MKSVWIIARHTIKAIIRKKDFYVFFLMLLGLLGFLVSKDFFGVTDVSRYVKDVGFFCLWIFSFIIAVTFSAKQLPEEMDSKTVYPLLAKPVSRAHLLMGRFLGSVLASALAFTFFYLLYLGFVFFRGEGIAGALLAQSYILGLCFLTMVCALTGLLSLSLALSAAITFSFAIYLVIMWFANSLRVIALSSRGPYSVFLTVLYYLIPHYEFYDMRIRLAHSWDALPLWIFSSIIIYTAVYTAIVLYASHIVLKKRIL